MARVSPGNVVTHTEQEILALVGGSSGGLATRIDQLEFDFGGLDSSVSNISGSVSALQGDVGTLQTTVGVLDAAVTAQILDIQQVQIGIGNAQNDISQVQGDVSNVAGELDQTKLDLIALDSTVTTLPKGTIVVTSLPVSPTAIGGGMTLYLNVLDPDLRGLYAWDGTAWVNPGKLLDGSVTAEKLDAGIIFSAEIEAGEITETHIADDSISTPKLRAGSVTTSKLVVGNFANLCENNDFELGDSSWTKGQGWTINNEPANAYNGNWIGKRAGYGVGSVLSNVKFKCVPNQKYIAQAHIKRGTSTDGYGAVRVVTINSSGVETVVDTGNQITASTFTMSEVTVTIPDGAVSVRVEVIATNTTGFIYVDQGVLSINSLTVIEDGSITTDKLAVNSVTANKIISGAVTTDKMTVANLSAISANMGNLTSGTITLDAAGHIKGGQTAYNTGTGFWQGYNGGFYKISFGNSTQGFTWDGSNFTIKGGSININNKFTVTNGGGVSIKSAATGARLEIANNVIKVFDSTGTLRVRIGDLSA